MSRRELLVLGVGIAALMAWLYAISLRLPPSGPPASDGVPLDGGPALKLMPIGMQETMTHTDDATRSATIKETD